MTWTSGDIVKEILDPSKKDWYDFKLKTVIKQRIQNCDENLETWDCYSKR